MLVFAVFVCASVHAQLPPSDTLLHLRTVEISSSKVKRYAAATLQIEIDSLLIKTHYHQQLDQILSTQSLAHIRSYGPGSVSTISLRGMSPSHTATIWNGLNLNSSFLGLSDAALLPVFFFDDISVVHGTMSSLTGNNSIAGAVALASSSSAHQGTKLMLLSEAGSFGEYKLAGRLDVGRNKSYHSLRALRGRAQNDFCYDNFTQFGTPHTIETNAKSATDAIMYIGNYAPNTKNNMSVSLWYQHNERQIPPLMTAFESKEFQNDSALRAVASWKRFIKKGFSNLQLAWLNEQIFYANPLNGIESLSTSHKGLVSHELSYGPWRWVDLGMENATENINASADEYGANVEELRASSAFAANMQLPRRTRMTIQLQKQFVQGFDPPVVFAVGADKQINGDNLIIHAKYATGYLVPTLNDRYWIPGGNLNLRPESSSSMETGFFLTNKRKTSKVAFQIYRMMVDDWIQWAPTLSGYFAPANLKKVKSQGVELATEKSFSSQDKKLKFKLIASLNDVTNVEVYGNPASELIGKQLVYVPNHKLSASVSISSKKYFANTITTLTGRRFTDVPNTQEIDPYLLTNISLGGHYSLNKLKFDLNFSVNNLMEAQYQTIAWRAMPGRSFHITLLSTIN